jgi:hypothetical protein
MNNINNGSNAHGNINGTNIDLNKKKIILTIR